MKREYKCRGGRIVILDWVIGKDFSETVTEQKLQRKGVSHASA